MRKMENSGPQECSIKSLIFGTKRKFLMRETPKLCPREWSIKCLIYDRLHGFLGVKRKKRVRASGA